MGFVVILILIPLIGAAFLAIGKAKSLKRLESQAGDEVRRRLESIASDVGGTVVEGPALETEKGSLSLIASSPKSRVIDVARFTSNLSTAHQLLVVAVQDAGKAPTRGLREVTPDDPAVAFTYKVFATDEAWARSVVNSKLAERLRAVDAVVRARSRLQIARGKATITAVRGLAKPEELRAFYDSCVAVVDCIGPHLAA